MAEQTDNRPVHRANTIKSALHILEHSKAESIDKVNAALISLYPDDLKAIEMAISQTLKNIENKV